MRSSFFLVTFIVLALAATSSSFAQMNDTSMKAGDDFDSGNLRAGETFSHTFNTTGAFAYHCHIHPGMMGTVNVVATSGTATTAAVSIQNFAFSPKNVTIATGGTVTWTNLDSSAHTVTADAAMGHGSDGAKATQKRGPKAFGLAENNSFEKLSADKAAKGLDRANASKLFGKLEYSNGAAMGRFVSFNWSDSTGTLSDLRHNVWGEAIFSSVTIAPWTMQEASEAHGAVFHAYGMDQFVSIHNNPTASLHIQTGENETNVTFHLAATEHINTNLSTDKVYVVTDDASKYHGHLILLGNASATNTTGPGGSIAVHLGANDGVLFLAHPGPDTAGASGLHAAVSAASQGHLGTVLDVSDAGDGTAVEDETPLSAHAAATHVEHGKVVLTVSSDTSDGKTIVIHLPRDTIGAGDVTVTVAGESFNATNVTDQDAKAALAALQAAGKGAIVTFAQNGTEVDVQVPHFSDQIVTIQQGTASPDGTTTTTTTATTAATGATPTTAAKGTPGFEVAALVGAVLAVALVAARRRA